MKNDIKIILFSLSLLLAIFFSSYSINKYIIRTTDYMLSEIKIIESYIDQDQWNKAYAKSEELGELWEKIEDKWTLIINHHEIDNITVSLKSVNEYVKTHNKTDAHAYISVLEHYVEHIPKMEELSWKNIF
jgi:hypothetical protein